jgi:hypothetical protein
LEGTRFVMKPSASDARTYRWLGALALVHAISAILAFSLLADKNGIEREWCVRAWVALVTLWIFWPIVLILHPGRSASRLGLFAAASALLLWPSLHYYNFLAARIFGLPLRVDLNPVEMWEYYGGWRAGRAQAQRDAAAGIMAIEEYGFGAGTGFSVRILRDRYHIEERPIAQCIVNGKILGHAAGYNEISKREIDRRVGLERVAAARAEGARLAAENTARHNRYYKELSARFSRASPDAKVHLTSVQRFVRAVADFVNASVPADSPAFTLHISADLDEVKPPHFETSGSLSAPRAVYMKIYRDLPNLRLPPWHGKRLPVALDFVIRGKPSVQTAARTE